jgi:hypothetical protein
MGLGNIPVPNAESPGQLVRFVTSLLAGPLLFVAIAAIRNARLPPVEDDDVNREWTEAEREQFKCLIDKR